MLRNHSLRVDMASTKQAQVVITANATTAKKVMDELRSKAKQCYNQMQQLAEAGKQNTKAFKTAEKEFNAYNNAIAHNVSATKRVDEVMKNLAGTSTRDLKRALGAAKRELNEMAGNSPKLKQMQKNIAAIKAQIDKNNGSIRTHNSLWKNAVKNITAYVGVFGAFNLVRSKLQGVIRDNLKFSDQLTDIRKVSGLTTDQVNKLAIGLSKLDTRTTIQGLSEIAYQGSKLGIGKYGVEGLNSFVKAANQVNVALKEDMGPEALTAMSKITEVMGLIPKMGVEKSMLRVGSAVFKLASTSTATSNNIIEFTKRLTGMARTAGITTDQLLALGSASDSMYLMPEVASTAFNKLISSLQTKHNLIEKELGISPGTISNLFAAGKAMDAIVLIFEKMHSRGNMNALQDVFKDLGSDGARMANVMVTMAKNVNMLKDHLAESKEAFEEGTAVTAEYEMQQETAQGIMERANNLWEKLFVNPAGIDNVKEMAQSWYDLTESLTSSQLFVLNIQTSFSLLTLIVKGLITLLPTLIEFLLFKGVATVVMNIVSTYTAWRASIISTTTATTAQTAATEGATVAQVGLNTAMKANIFGLIASLIATAVTWLLDYGSASTVAAEGQRSLNDYMAEAASNVDLETRKLRSYIAVLSDTNTSIEDRSRILRKFNSEYGTYIDSLGIEIKTVKDLRTHYDKLNESIRQKMYYEIKEKASSELLGEKGKTLGAALLRYNDYISSHTEYYGFDSKWLKGQVSDGKKGTQSVYRNIIESIYGKSGTWSNYDGAYILSTGSVNDIRLRGLITNVINAVRGYNKVSNDLNKTFDPFIGSYNPFLGDKPGVLNNNAKDPDALRAAREAESNRKKAEREARQAKRYELKDAEEDVKAIIDNVKNYYDRQITSLYRIASETDMEETLRDQLEAGIKARMNIALSNARKSIADVKNDWESFKKTMTNDLIEQDGQDGYNESKVLLERIGEVNIGTLRSRITQLSTELKRPGTSLLDQVWHNASKNEQFNAKSANKVEQARRQKILEDNYTGKVDNDYLNTFEQLGFSPLDALHSQAVLSGGDNARDVIRTRNDSIQSVFDQSRKNFDALQMLDVDSLEGRRSLLELLFGTEKERTSAVVDLGTLFDKLSEGARVEGGASDDIRLFYDTLIKYNDDYTEALKKAADRQKKLLDFRWGHTEDKTNFDAQVNRLNQQKEGVWQFTPEAAQKRDEGDSTTEDHGVYGNWEVLPSFGADPEVELYKVKMQAAQAYYEFLKAAHADESVLATAQKQAQEVSIDYTKSLIGQMKSRMEELYGLFAPIESFGSEIGEAFISSEKTVKQAVGGMINSFLKLTVNMMQETIKRRMFQLINDRLVSTQMVAAGKEQVAISKATQAKITSADKGAQTIRKMSFKDFAKQIFGLKKKNKKKELSIETDGQKTEKKVQKKGVKSLLKSISGSFSSLFRIKKKQKKQEKKLEKQTGKETLDISKSAETAKQTLTEASGQAIQQTLDKTAQTAIQTQKTQASESVQTKSSETQAKTSMGIASGAADIIGKLGWWGIPLVAVITALLNGLLSAAMGKVSSLFGGGVKSSDSSTNTKLVSGMLTYDAGNVQSFRGINDGRTYPVVGNDGRVYAASEAGDLSTGLVKDPITTLINGQPALVAERGPEMVIGRETTAALMMARPDLISEIVRFDRNRSGMTYRAYDSGNVAQFSGTGTLDSSSQFAELGETIAQLSSVISSLQKNGVTAHINKYGRGGLSSEAADGRRFMSRYSSDKRYE